jgi:hypothetical protein
MYGNMYKRTGAGQTGYGRTGGKRKMTWMQHVSMFRKKHPYLSFKEALMKASKTYHKK